jgi:hypothetical protein
MRTFDVSYAVMIGLALLLCFVLTLSIAGDAISKARKLKKVINESVSHDKRDWFAKKYGILVRLMRRQPRSPRFELKLVAESSREQSCNLPRAESAAFPSRAKVLVLNQRGTKKDYSSHRAIGNLLTTDRYAMTRRKGDEAFERRMHAR